MITYDDLKSISCAVVPAIFKGASSFRIHIRCKFRNRKPAPLVQALKYLLAPLQATKGAAASLLLLSITKATLRAIRRLLLRLLGSWHRLTHLLLLLMHDVLLRLLRRRLLRLLGGRGTCRHAHKVMMGRAGSRLMTRGRTRHVEETSGTTSTGRRRGGCRCSNAEQIAA